MAYYVYGWERSFQWIRNSSMVVNFQINFFKFIGKLSILKTKETLTKDYTIETKKYHKRIKTSDCCLKQNFDWTHSLRHVRNWLQFDVYWLTFCVHFYSEHIDVCNIKHGVNASSYLKWIIWKNTKIKFCENKFLLGWQKRIVELKI